MKTLNKLIDLQTEEWIKEEKLINECQFAIRIIKGLYVPKKNVSLNRVPGL